MKNNKTPKVMYAGFSDGKLSDTLEYYGDRFRIAAIYFRKADARKHYEDVRKVRVVLLRVPKGYMI